jgi:hypothetical protein
MNESQINEAIRIAMDFSDFTADERKILLKVSVDSPLLSPWVNNPVPLAAVRSLFMKLDAIPSRPAA